MILRAMCIQWVSRLSHSDSDEIPMRSAERMRSDSQLTTVGGSDPMASHYSLRDERGSRSHRARCTEVINQSCRLPV